MTEWEPLELPEQPIDGQLTLDDEAQPELEVEESPEPRYDPRTAEIPY
jgi:hypothetical protein